MKSSRLSPLQKKVLLILADIQPPWTLTGGAALAGFHTGHRETRDLDFLWHGREMLERIPQQVKTTLGASGLEVETIQTEASFGRLRASDGREVVLLDLMADPLKPAEEPRSMALEGVHFLVDTPHEILVNKLCALLGRAELRDLQDVQAILAWGGDLDRAFRDAPEKDGGFSGATLAWLLHDLPLAPLGAASGLGPADIAALETFRDELVARVLDAAHPEQGPE